MMANIGHLVCVYSLQQLPIQRGLLYIMRWLCFCGGPRQELLVLELYPSKYYINGLLWRAVSWLSLRELRRLVFRSVRICGSWQSTAGYTGCSSQQLAHRGPLHQSSGPGHPSYISAG